MKHLLHLPPIALSLASLASAQTTWYVDVNGNPPGSGTQNDPYTSLRYALEQPTTLSGDTLLVLPGTYPETFDLLGKTVTITGTDGAAQTVIDAGGAPGVGSVLTVASGEGPGTRVEGLTLRGGTGTFRHPDGEFGGGALVEGSHLDLVDCVVEGNVAGFGAGVAVDGSTVVIRGCTLRANDMAGQAFTGPPQGGGLRVVGGATVRVEGGSVSENFGLVLGHGVGVYVGGATLHMRGVLVEDNASGDYDSPSTGAGICSDLGSTLVVRECEIRGNGYNSYAGGGIYGVGEVYDTLIEDNFAQQGAGVYGPGLGGLKLFDCKLLRNWANTIDGNVGGGAAYASLVRCEVRENYSFGEAGGTLHCVLVECDVVDNVCEGWPPFYLANGGGIYGGSAFDCRIEGNAVLGDNGLDEARGGGAFGAKLEHCVLARNKSEYGAGAAGSSLFHCTLVDNVARVAGGGLFGGGATNSIVWGNLPDQVDPGMPASVTYSTVEGGYPGTGNLSGDPLFFAPLTGDVHLKAGSPCIDAGDPATPPDDDGSVADQGAYPFDPTHCAAPATWCVAKPSSLGCVPVIFATGSTSLGGPDDLVVRARSVPGQVPGLLLWSLTPDEVPFHGGTLCLGGALVRTPVQSSGGVAGVCEGGFAFPLTHAYLGGAGLGAYSTLYAQYWFRDAGFPPPDGVGLTAALEITLCP